MRCAGVEDDLPHHLGCERRRHLGREDGRLPDELPAIDVEERRVLGRVDAEEEGGVGGDERDRRGWRLGDWERRVVAERVEGVDAHAPARVDRSAPLAVGRDGELEDGWCGRCGGVLLLLGEGAAERVH